MDDKELIEVWRKEFHAEIRNRGGTVSFDGRNADLCVDGEAVDFLYFDDRLNHCWYGFLMARRSQPVVELPVMRFSATEPIFYVTDEVHSALTAAGIQYKVRG